MKNNIHRKIIASAISLIFCSATHATSYNVTLLPNLADCQVGGASSINAKQQIVGFCQGYNPDKTHAIIWNKGIATDLGSLDSGVVSAAYDINTAGDVVGNSLTSKPGENFAVVWTGTGIINLGSLYWANSFAFGINDSGQIVGQSPVNNMSSHAVVWNNRVATDLGNLSGQNSAAFAINSKGQIAGFAQVKTPSDNYNHAALWNGTSITDLGTLGGLRSEAYSINDMGQVVGYAEIGSRAWHATLWSAGTITDLGTLGGGSSFARKINNSGQIVGWAEATNGQTHAAIWNSKIATDLNNYLSPAQVSAGWVLSSASSIDNNGNIVGQASNTITNVKQGFLLTVKPIAMKSLINGDFESGSTGWTASSGVLTRKVGQQPHGGKGFAWLGGYGKKHTDSLSQLVSIPAVGTTTLGFWLHIDTNEKTGLPTDFFYVRVIESNGTTSNLKVFSNQNAATGYQQQAIDLSAFAGKKITLKFLSSESAKDQTSFVVDDVTVTSR